MMILFSLSLPVVAGLMVIVSAAAHTTKIKISVCRMMIWEAQAMAIFHFLILNFKSSAV
jgi:hypothetical protein